MNTRFPLTNDLLDQAGIRCNTIMKYDFISILWPCYMEMCYMEMEGEQ